jgi:DNA-binding NarL/FixJ family response regulator
MGTIQDRVRRILLADDSECARSIIRRSLEADPMMEVCGEAEDGVDAIAKAQALDPDLIMLDLAMPEMNGVEAASVLRAKFPETPIVLVTIYENAVGAVLGGMLASTVGVTAAVSKHEGILAILKCVRKLLHLAS